MIVSPKSNQSTMDFVKSVGGQLKEVCAPLYESLNFKHFAHLRYYRDGRYFHLCDNLKWVQTRFENSLNLNVTCRSGGKNILKPGWQVFQWSGEPTNPLHATLYDMDIWNGCTVYNVLPEYIEVWGFGSKREDVQKVNFYLNEMELLKRFTLYFKSKTEKLINTTNPQHFFQDPSLKSLFDISTGIEEKRSTFLGNTDIAKYIYDENVSFSKQEHMSMANQN